MYLIQIEAGCGVECPKFEEIQSQQFKEKLLEATVEEKAVASEGQRKWTTIYQ